MERSPLTSLAALAVVAVLAMALMWLFTLNQVTDTGVTGAAAAIDATLARSLDPGTKSRVTMVRDGAGVAASRRYVVRLRPSPAVAADASAVARLCERASRVVLNHVSAAKGEVFVHCEADVVGGTAALSCFRRTGADGAWDLEPVVPVPPLPIRTSPTEPTNPTDFDGPHSNAPRDDAPTEDTKR